ncbi:hypothetical protein AOQ84DRAFT_374225 [Glonium stellatum]|uniref:Uncharacterized protein n=1 Tax=Glonium stellatum TaxID=574774 RepID=A0A8E2F6H8_9PEZI|nr:hypothetical protein AOQ84DRAFT_374225 [Glonium stellatum]
MWRHSQADEILDRLYDPKIDHDSMTIAECFIVAAMGAHYDLECFPDIVRKALYVSGTMHFDEKIAKLDYLRTMRLLLSIVLCNIGKAHECQVPPAGLQIVEQG